jgi:NAD(P)-dependent dehydrogenase (short-subunit alcohol dehydrogenase family)
MGPGSSVGLSKNPMIPKKTIFITGSSTGLGRAAAVYFAANGWNVAATMRKPQAEATLQTIPTIKVFELDVTRAETIGRALEDATAAFGKIDVVLNNAGVGLYGALELAADEAIDQQYAVNVRGVIDVIRTFLPHFRQQGGGTFINVSSVMGRSTALPLGSLYNMSKFAVEGLTEGLYFELKPLNINLHLVEPGGFASSFGESTTFSKSDHIRDYDVITRNVEGAMKAAAKPGVMPGPEFIVKAIYELATGKRKAFRTVVGQDARMVLLLRKLLPIKVFLNLLAKRFSNE